MTGVAALGAAVGLIGCGQGKSESAGTGASSVSASTSASETASNESASSAQEALSSVSSNQPSVAPTVMLSSGFAMPLLGIGTWTLSDAVAEESVYCALESWYPLGGRGHTDVLFGDDTIDSIAASHGVTPAQIILRWHGQAGFIAIPGSSNHDHIAENIGIFDFELTEDEMTKMAALNRQQRFENW